MTIPASKSNETYDTSELYSIVADIAATYGDPHGKYIAFLSAGEPNYTSDGFFLWDQPLPGNGNGSSGINGSTSTTKSSALVTQNKSLVGAMVLAIVAVAVGSVLDL